MSKMDEIKADLNSGKYSFPAETVQWLVRRVEVHCTKINRIYQIWGVEPDEGDAVTNMIEAHDSLAVTEDAEQDWEVQDDDGLNVEENESV